MEEEEEQEEEDQKKEEDDINDDLGGRWDLSIRPVRGGKQSEMESERRGDKQTDRTRGKTL